MHTAQVSAFVMISGSKRAQGSKQCAYVGNTQCHVIVTLTLGKKVTILQVTTSKMS